MVATSAGRSPGAGQDASCARLISRSQRESYGAAQARRCNQVHRSEAARRHANVTACVHEMSLPGVDSPLAGNSAGHLFRLRTAPSNHRRPMRVTADEAGADWAPPRDARRSSQAETVIVWPPVRTSDAGLSGIRTYDACTRADRPLRKR